MAPINLSKLGWHKSSYSALKGDGCVEVARTREAVAVRDAKDPNGPVLIVPPATFTRFINSVR